MVGESACECVCICLYVCVVCEVSGVSVFVCVGELV